MFWRGVWAYLPANIVQGVVGLLTIVVFTRLLTPEQFGLYALGFSVMTLVHTIGFTWLEASMARFFAAEQARDRLADHFKTLYRAYVVMALVFTPVCAIGLWLWPANPALKMAIGAGLGAILGRCLIKLVQERRRAAGEVVSASALDIGQTVGGFALGALFAVLGLGGAAPLIGAGLAAVLCLPFALPKELTFLKGGHFEAERGRRYAAYGLPISASLILALALATTDRFLIAAYLDAGSVGAYHAAYSLANRTLDVIFLWLGAAGGPALVMALERGGRAVAGRGGARTGFDCCCSSPCPLRRAWRWWRGRWRRCWLAKACATQRPRSRPGSRSAASLRGSPPIISTRPSPWRGRPSSCCSRWRSRPSSMWRST